ncbi:MAG: hypothetical protein RIA69_19665 [Cyclobacteriaceae bacterium]
MERTCEQLLIGARWKACNASSTYVRNMRGQERRDSLHKGWRVFLMGRPEGKEKIKNHDNPQPLGASRASITTRSGWAYIGLCAIWQVTL